jgi:Fur family ferric uptake transcriptional regulator
MERCNAEKLLEKSKTKKTESRQRILNFILDSKAPISANKLHKAIGGNIDLATVYRSLKTFTDKGLVRTIRTDDDRIYYEKSCEHNPLHAHFYCESCGNVECLKPFGFEESSLFMSMAKERDVRGVELVIKGRCKTCG